MKYTYNYPMQTVAADAVVFCGKEVLLIKRGKEPCKGQYALPGGHLDLDDRNTKETSDRELKEETGIDVESKYVVLSGEVGVFSELGRDPRGRYISVAYYYLLSEKPKLEIDPKEIESYKWFKVDSLSEGEIAFDHYQMIQQATEKLKQHLKFQ